MAISATYLQLQRQIADELGNRTDLLVPLSSSGLVLSPIKNAIMSAISKWERELFYFNETYYTQLFATTAGTEFYFVTTVTVTYIVSLNIVVSGNRFPLTARTWDYLEDKSLNSTSRGQPSEWAYFAQQIRLYPVPDKSYSIRASVSQRLSALSADSDANAWTQDGYDLIRSEAKLILARETLFDDELAKRMHIAIYGDPVDPRSRGYLYDLKAETARRARGRIIPTQF